MALADVRVLPARDVAAGQEGKVYSWRRTSRVGWGANAPAPAAATRQSAEPQVASPQVVRLCLLASGCLGLTRLQYTAVYCSILQYTEMFFFSHRTGFFTGFFSYLLVTGASLVSQIKKMKTALCTCAGSPCPEPEPSIFVLFENFIY